MVLALVDEELVRLGSMSVFCGRVGRAVVDEVADVSAMSAETAVTPETAWHDTSSHECPGCYHVERRNRPSG